MFSTAFNEAEDAALRRLPWRARIVYLQGIRRYMDYTSGWSGKKRILSYQFFHELLECTDHTTAPDPSVSKDGLRAIFRMLERAGLVEWPRGTSTQRGVVFRCLLADTDQSVQIQDAPKTHPPDAPKTHPQDAPSKPHGNAGSNDEDAPTLYRPDAPPIYTLNAPPPESGIKGRKEKPISVISPSDDGVQIEPGTFAEFWSAYPKKVGKKPASEKWKAKGLNRIGSAIVADVKERARKDRKWLDGFVPNPMTYLTQERWDDEIEVAESQESHAEKVKRQLRESGMGAGQVIEGRWSNG